MKYIFESKEKEAVDDFMKKEQAIARDELKKLMVCFELMANTMYPELRVHLTVIKK